MVPLYEMHLLSGKKQSDAKRRARSTFSDFWECPNYVLLLFSSFCSNGGETT